RWKATLDVLTKPEILGDVVLLSVRTPDAGDEVVALSADDGSELWRLPLGDLAYMGAARSAGRIAVVTSVGAMGGARRQSQVRAVEARTGAMAWEHAIDGVLGAPAARGPWVFVPWERQNIAILDMATGRERARLRSTDDVITWVDAGPEGVHYGSHGMYRLTGRSYTGNREEATYRWPMITDAPNDPFLMEDDFIPKAGLRSARSRIRFFVAPKAAKGDDTVALVGDTVYYVYYRYVFAFDTERKLRWVRIVPTPIAGGQVLSEGLLVLGEGGDARILGVDTGLDLWAKDLPAEAIASVAVEASTLSIPAPPAGRQAPELRASLRNVASDGDNTLAAGRAYAIGLLAALPEPEVTRDLLELYSQPSMPGVLRAALREAVRRRTSGAEYLVASLESHYDFLQGTQGPPLDLIAPALVNLDAKEALPGLLEQLIDHETPARFLPETVAAIAALGDATVIPVLMDFLTRYRADSAFSENPAPLLAAADAIFTLGGEEERESLRVLATSAPTAAVIGTHVESLFAKERAAEEARALAEREAAARAAREAQARERAARPLRLTQAQINDAFEKAGPALRECILEELGRDPKLGRVRMTFILLPEGRATEVHYAPKGKSFVACAAPVVESIRFPPFRARRQAAAFSITLRRAEEPEPDGSDDGEPDGPWWVRNRSSFFAKGESTEGTPWWVVKDAPKPEEPAAEEPSSTPEEGGEGTGEDEQPWWVPVASGDSP
ncbi:MAG: PQQ-binding-like beta-propeller repeat protein, partial [Myxococcales bacterium]|nr:PQQ-binding-like beta-propeller repeat protein [Myxococcales bacterium]